MVAMDEFPDWARIADYFESKQSEPVLSTPVEAGKTNYEELLNIEAYQLLKLLKQL
jgi:hypothetical protein